MSGGLWLSETEVVEMMSLPQAIDALRDGLREEAAGQAVNMVKTHATWANGSTLHAIGAVFQRAGFVGTKTWAHTAHGAMPLLVLIDAENGSVRSIIEAFALGQMRTGGISGLATDLLARPDATRMAMVGAGKQSLAQIAAVAAVRKLERVTVWSPTPTSREALAEKVEKQLGICAIATHSLDEALDAAEIVTLATRAREPFLAASALPSGVHINAVGAITPERQEFEPALLERATICAADSVPQVRKLSSEFIAAFGDNENRWSRLRSLSELVAAETARPASADLTVFKAMGMGISDLSLGIAIYRRAIARRESGDPSFGAPLPAVTRVPPRFT